MTFWCFLSIIIVGAIAAVWAYDQGETEGYAKSHDKIMELKEENKKLKKKIKKLVKREDC